MDHWDFRDALYDAIQSVVQEDSWDALRELLREPIVRRPGQNLHLNRLIVANLLPRMDRIQKLAQMFVDAGYKFHHDDYSFCWDALQGKLHQVELFHRDGHPMYRVLPSFYKFTPDQKAQLLSLYQFFDAHRYRFSYECDLCLKKAPPGR